MATVAKPFNSITQRFKLGAPVSENDDLAPHSFEDLKTRGFISDKSDTSSEKPDALSLRSPIKPSTRNDTL